ncbi:MAG: O-antigen ligase family protein [Alphaproteobacteria bacterium]|nr:O-antigen ligase family protein [Alphaproteobacteria bacterium]
MIRNSLLTLQIEPVQKLYQENRSLFLSSLFIPVIAPLFFYCPTSILRTLFYISIPFLVTLVIKNKQAIWGLLSQDKITWGVLALFSVYMSTSVLWSSDAEISRYFSKGKLSLILGLTTISTFYISYRFPKFSDILKNSYILGATSSAIILIIHYLLTHGFSLPTERLEGLGRATNPVQASLLYGLAVIAIIFGKLPFQHTRRQVYILKMAMILPSLVIILMTQSRGPFLALLLTLVIIFILQSRNRIKAFSCGLIAIILVSVSVYGAFKNTDILNRKTTGRFQIWQTAISQIKEHPIIGHGLATNNRYHYTKDDGTVMEASHIHSLYLSTAFQGGLIGLGLLIWIYYLFAIKYIDLIRKKVMDHMWIGGWVLMGAAFGIADFGGIVINLSTEWLVFWWPIGLLWGQMARRP